LVLFERFAYIRVERLGATAPHLGSLDTVEVVFWKVREKRGIVFRPRRGYLGRRDKMAISFIGTRAEVTRIKVELLYPKEMWEEEYDQQDPETYWDKLTDLLENMFPGCENLTDERWTPDGDTYVFIVYIDSEECVVDVSMEPEHIRQIIRNAAIELLDTRNANLT
jgi:hypothetical protein